MLTKEKVREFLEGLKPIRLFEDLAGSLSALIGVDSIRGVPVHQGRMIPFYKGGPPPVLLAVTGGLVTGTEKRPDYLVLWWSSEKEVVWLLPVVSASSEEEAEKKGWTVAAADGEVEDLRVKKLPDALTPPGPQLWEVCWEVFD